MITRTVETDSGSESPTISNAPLSLVLKYCINKLLDHEPKDYEPKDQEPKDYEPKDYEPKDYELYNEATRLGEWHRNLELHVTNICLPRLDPSRDPQMFQVKSDGWPRRGL